MWSTAISSVTLILLAVIGYFINKYLETNRIKNEKKREVYEQFLEGAQVLFSGVVPEKKKEEHKWLLLISYEKVKLWGNQVVIDKTGEFIEYNENRIIHGQEFQDGVKSKYIECIIAMRKDLNKRDSTRMTTSNIRFVSFNNNG